MAWTIMNIAFRKLSNLKTDCFNILELPAIYNMVLPIRHIRVERAGPARPKNLYNTIALIKLAKNVAITMYSSFFVCPLALNMSDILANLQKSGQVLRRV